jgi:Calcineurin-like phosphoesterase
MLVRISTRLLRQKSHVYFQILSDLHLELGQQYSHFHIPASAPYLILAGDIGNLCHYQLYLDFLRRQCENFRQVFLVLGNHEFYGISRNEGLRLAALLEQEAALQGKLKILNRTRVDMFSDVVILGCTLQSCISPGSRAIIECKVKDFKRIQQWTVDDHNAEHSRDVDWLEEQISAIKKEDMENGHRLRRILVVTHHAPIRQGASRSEHEDTPWSGAFGTALLDVVNNKSSSLLDVEWWIFGHTHYTTNIVQGTVKLISNQRGYALPKSDEERLAARPEMGMLRFIQYLFPCFSSHIHHRKHDFNVRRTIKV